MLTADDIGDQEFDSWASTKLREYDSDEKRASRRSIYKENAAYVANFNALPPDEKPGGPDVVLALNDFADYTQEEFATQFASGMTLKPSDFAADGSGDVIDRDSLASLADASSGSQSDTDTPSDTPEETESDSGRGQDKNKDKQEDKKQKKGDDGSIGQPVEDMSKQENGVSPAVDHASAAGQDSAAAPSRLRGGNGNGDAPASRSLAPASVDWVAKGAVGPVRNQGSCNSCWAFAAAAALEGASFVKTGKLVKLSPQQLLDCSGAGTCSGGYTDQVFNYIARAGGMCADTDYASYKNYASSCTRCSTASGTKTTGYKDVPQSQAGLEEALSKAPLLVQVNSVNQVWQFYKSGVVTGSCPTASTHAVIAVGYGSDNGRDYYTLKNQWGTTWGEGGYIRLGRGSQYGAAGQCGVQLVARYPVLA